MKYFSILFLSIVLFCCNQPAEENAGNKIAVANGFNNFKKVQMLEFTFNAQRDTAKASSRHWQWFPQTNDVVFITDSSTIKFKRNDTTTQELKKLNAKFTNDEYWLVYPFHLNMDKGFDLVDSSLKTAPICGKEMHKITVKYNDKDGYTPGDMYDLFLDENDRIQEWVYHNAGSAEPSMITSWENYKDFNGLQLSQEHKSKDGKFHLWFTGIQVKSN